MEEVKRGNSDFLFLFNFTLFTCIFTKPIFSFLVVQVSKVFPFFFFFFYTRARRMFSFTFIFFIVFYRIVKVNSWTFNFFVILFSPEKQV